MTRHSAAADIDAPVEAVWRVLADIGQWPSWDPNTGKAEGVVGKNAALNFTFAGKPVEVRVTAADEPFLLEWSGNDGLRTHRITPREEFSRIEVSQDGSDTERSKLDSTFKAFVQALKQRVESASEAS